MAQANIDVWEGDTGWFEASGAMVFHDFGCVTPRGAWMGEERL